MSDEMRQSDERPADEAEERQKARTEEEGPEVEGHRWGKHSPVERISDVTEQRRS